MYVNYYYQYSIFIFKSVYYLTRFRLVASDFNNINFANNAGLLVTPSRYKYASSHQRTGSVTMTTNPTRYTLDPTSAYTTGVPTGVLYSPWETYTLPSISVSKHQL